MRNFKLYVVLEVWYRVYIDGKSADDIRTKFYNIAGVY